MDRAAPFLMKLGRLGKGQCFRSKFNKINVRISCFSIGTTLVLGKQGPLVFRDIYSDGLKRKSVYEEEHPKFSRNGQHRSGAFKRRRNRDRSCGIRPGGP